MNMFFAYFVIFISGLIQVISEDDFDYNEDDSLGPSRWKEKYKSCGGMYQSPINIEKSLAEKVSLPPLEIAGFDSLIQSYSIVNDGRTVRMEVNIPKYINISGGPLQKSEYKHSKFYFHWGADDSSGSENTIDSRSFPMELQLIFYNFDNSTTNATQENPEDIVILAYLYEISSSDNEAYNVIIDSLSNIQSAHAMTALTTIDAFTLSSLLHENNRNYFTFNGSLTFPPCTEDVTWIVFEQPIKISGSQMNEFRKIRSKTGFIHENFRPVQPLSNRNIQYNRGSSYNSGSDSGYYFRFVLLICCISLVMVRHFS